VELGSKLKSRPVLILTGDGCVDAVSSNRQKIQSLFRISLPSEETLQALADKSRFQELARRQGFDIPRGASLEGTEDLKRLEDLRLPLILKPANKKLVLAKSVERAVRAMTLSEAKSAAMRMLANAPEIIVQEWVDGPDSEIFFSLFSCDGDGNIVGIFTGRKVVCSPPGIGNTAICIAAPEEAAELQALVSRFVATVGYRGLGSIEFKRDRKTRRFVMIEPTVGRTDWQEEIATVCGVNLPLITYWTVLGTPSSSTVSAGRRVAWRSSIEHRIPSGALRPGTSVVDGVFRLSDPLPAVYFYVLERFASRILAQLAFLFHGSNRRSERRELA